MRTPERLPRCLCVFVIAVAACLPLHAQPSVEFFPGHKLYPAYRADALAHQLSLSRVTDNREWIGVIGGLLPLLEIAEPGFTMQVGLGASVFNRILKTPGHITVQTIDYRIDFPFDFLLGAFTIRVGYGHISNHYADDGLEILGLRSINAVKDYVQLGVARWVSLVRGDLYIGAAFNYHNEPLPDRRWMFQAGSNFGNYPLTSWLTVYGAIDIKIKEEVRWGTTQSYQAGLAFVPRGGYAIRLAYTHRTGFEERGQVYDQSVTANLVSLTIDF
jgi:hypothetical protein